MWLDAMIVMKKLLRTVFKNNVELQKQIVSSVHFASLNPLPSKKKYSKDNNMVSELLV